MPQRPPAAILIQPEQPHPDKQEVLCLEYAEASKFRVVVLCFNRGDAIALAMAGTVQSVITAVDPGGLLAEDLERWGARLHVVRNIRTRVRLDVNDLVNRMHLTGLDSQEIARILQVDTKDIRRSLFRSGIRRPDHRE